MINILISMKILNKISRSYNSNSIVKRFSYNMTKAFKTYLKEIS